MKTLDKAEVLKTLSRVQENLGISNGKVIEAINKKSLEIIKEI